MRHVRFSVTKYTATKVRCGPTKQRRPGRDAGRVEYARACASRSSKFGLLFHDPSLTLTKRTGHLVEYRGTSKYIVIEGLNEGHSRSRRLANPRPARPKILFIRGNIAKNSSQRPARSSFVVLVSAHHTSEYVLMIPPPFAKTRHVSFRARRGLPRPETKAPREFLDSQSQSLVGFSMPTPSRRMGS